MFFLEAYNELINANEEWSVVPSSAESNQPRQRTEFHWDLGCEGHPTTAGLACLQQEEHLCLLCQLLHLPVCTLSIAVSLT